MKPLTAGLCLAFALSAARSALDRFLYDLLDPQDEIFLQQFSNDPNLL